MIWSACQCQWELWVELRFVLVNDHYVIIHWQNSEHLQWSQLREITWIIMTCSGLQVRHWNYEIMIKLKMALALVLVVRWSFNFFLVIVLIVFDDLWKFHSIWRHFLVTDWLTSCDILIFIVLVDGCYLWDSII